ncbi:FxsB family cyclophane-forming radical SAM/SPASM peptide maturase [Streptosporangium sp. G11]|uniref:FxsB family cyclophane-forming radical SAM/SPASM peptide maturase n=1 Tax=Streptosporangium sp. G11 TaxID=3436926 RepID=UPI003EBE5CB8
MSLPRHRVSHSTPPSDRPHHNMPGAALPFRQFVLKVASRCDLACDHCYVYEHADLGWRSQPLVMSEETAARIGSRIAEYAAEHRLRRVHVVLHGGEPLLAGLARLERVAAGLRASLAGGAELDLRIHTNGVLLDERLCRMFAAHDVKVGISLDGGRAANDLHRRYADGRSSYDRVINAITLLRRYPGLYAGLLCTIDIRNDPIAVYEALIDLEPPRIDFLLPHATWDHPPIRPSNGVTDYADWLTVIYDRWTADGRPVAIRMFDSISLMARGKRSQTESLGLGPNDLVVIETDGSYEQADSLKITYDGAAATRMNVRRHSLDEVARHPGFQMRQRGLEALAEKCRQCPIVRTCGGGLPAHRYHRDNGFDNPSVYCSDLRRLIPHVRQDTRPGHRLPQRTLDSFASATAGPLEVASLDRPRRSVIRALVSEVRKLAGDTPAWRLLVRLDREHRPHVDQVLDYPYVQAWARRCVADGARGGEHARPEYLASVAAAAALRAGEPIEIAIPLWDGMAHLPGIGRIRMTDGPGDGHFVVRSDGHPPLTDGPGDGRFAVRSDGHPPLTGDAGDGHFVVRSDGHPPYRAEGGLWEPVRTLHAGGLSAVLDDVDPFRDVYGARVHDRLTHRDFSAWQHVLALAWDRVGRRPLLATVAEMGVKVITPLADPGIRSNHTRAYRAIGMSRPYDPDDTADGIIRELFRSQIGLLLHVFDLTGGGESANRLLSEAYAKLGSAIFGGLVKTDLDKVTGILELLQHEPMSVTGRNFVARMRANLGFTKSL